MPVRFPGSSRYATNSVHILDKRQPPRIYMLGIKCTRVADIVSERQSAVTGVLSGFHTGYRLCSAPRYWLARCVSRVTVPADSF